MHELIHSAIQLLGLDVANMMGVLATVALFAQLVGKAIPDDATGLLGLIRKVAKVIGLYTPNKTGDVPPPPEPVTVESASARRANRSVNR